LFPQIKGNQTKHTSAAAVACAAAGLERTAAAAGVG